MSEMLNKLASGFPAAAEASTRLRAYVEDIDRFLGIKRISEFLNKSNAGDGIADQPPIDTEQTIPWNLLQCLPWDSPDWDISEAMQLP